MFRLWKREREIHCVLRRFARQRVAAVLQPGNVWVIEHAIDKQNEMNAEIATCLMYGWIEVLHDKIPHGHLVKVGSLSRPQSNPIGPTYRLTGAGWDALQRAHLWNLAAVAIGGLSLIAALAL